MRTAYSLSTDHTDTCTIIIGNIFDWHIKHVSYWKSFEVKIFNGQAILTSNEHEDESITNIATYQKSSWWGFIPICSSWLEQTRRYQNI